jgi:hypothetical protein
MKLTMFEKFMYWLGYQYVYNRNTNEVHRLKHKHINCKLESMSWKNKEYLTEYEVDKRFAQGANGCR